MLRSRAVQYFGLGLLLLTCLGVIFFPIGQAPAPQEFTIHLTVPKTWTELASAAAKTDKSLAGKSAVKIADAAFLKAFPEVGTVPQPLVISADDKAATVTARAAHRSEAADRARRVLSSLEKPFPGVAFAPATQDEIDALPVKPQFTMGQLAVFPFEPATAIKLGLDLRGGVSLVLQVRRALFTYNFDPKYSVDDKSREELLNLVREALSRTQPALKLDQADVNITPNTDNQLEVRTQAKDETEFNQQAAAIDAALKGIAGAGIKPARKPQFFQPKLEPGQTLDPDFEKQRLARTVEIIRSRVDSLGVSEPQIQSQGNSRIVVQLPGLKDPQKAVEVVGTTARMEIRLLPENLAPVGDGDNIQFVDRTTNQPVTAAAAREMSELIVEGEDVKPTTTAGPTGQMSREMGVFFELQGPGSARFAEVTRRVAGKGRYIPIFLDERCISAPTVQSAITSGSGQISGGFKDLEEARQLALLLNSGALPAPIDVVENRTVSPTLGSDSLEKSLNAGLIGLAAVALFMIVFYRLPGLLANCALAVYLVINLAAFILIGGTLTLPGVAGFLLAIAMSLDTNILVFERLHEEMAVQPNFTSALRAAFSRAWTAILDSHVTTLVAAAVLFNFGTGPVKGFALTLGIGVILSLFSAISVTRLFMWSVSRVGEKNPNLFGKPTPVAPAALTTK